MLAKELKIIEYEKFLLDSTTLAKFLLGKIIKYKNSAGIIVETESYPHMEEASHSARGRTGRKSVLFKKGGVIYTYKIFNNVCLNVVSGPPESGESVFIREVMVIKEGRILKTQIFGPGKWTALFGIQNDIIGKLVNTPESIYLLYGIEVPEDKIKKLPRIGIKKGKEKLLRFSIKKYILSL